MNKIELLVRNIQCSYRESESEAIALTLRRFGIKAEKFSVYKKSVDARKKNDIKYVLTALVTVADGTVIKENPSVTLFESGNYPDFKLSPTKEKLNPIIIGFGPCGMFCALLLARHGFQPIVFEQGECIEKRAESVSRYLSTGDLNTLSNIQFGEGGAGAFSDGKLITRVNDSRTSFILKTLHQHGAPEDILTQAKPHIGTDLLRNVVKSIREEIISLGGRVNFSCKVTDINQKSNGVEVEINGNEKVIAPSVFLATGHSSHDTYRMLMEKGFDISGKDFSVGVRIEHLREDVEYSMYGKAALEGKLPPAEYSVSLREGNRGVYSFCMCPGGLVMASASENGAIVTNGMSYHSRDKVNSNAALAVSVLASDYGNSALKAIEYQRNLERLAWKTAGDGKAPAQTVADFLDGKATTRFGKVAPSYPHGVAGCRLEDILPSVTSDMLKKGLRSFVGKHSFFADRSAVLTGVETRTSSPVRIAREKTLTAKGFDRIYPCGEGAGWAGGITSAALDGLRVAESYMLGEDYVQ